MEAGTKVKGYVNTSDGLKRRDAPSGNAILTALPNRTAITGVIAKDNANGDWVKLETINGATVSGEQYCAAWYCYLDAVSAPPPTSPAKPNPISLTAEITDKEEVVVSVVEPNGYPVRVFVFDGTNTVEYKKPS